MIGLFGRSLQPSHETPSGSSNRPSKSRRGQGIGLVDVVLGRVTMTKQQSHSKSTHEAAGMGPLLLLAYWPNAELFHHIWPQRAFGFSLWVTLLPTMAVLIMFVTQAGPRWLLRVTTGFVVSVAVLLARDAAGLNDVGGNFAQELAGVRYIFLLPVLAWLANHAVRQTTFARWAPWVMAVNGTVGCAVAIGYALGLYDFRIAANEDYALQYEITRAAGLMGGINVFAHTAVAALLATFAAPGIWLLSVVPVLFLGLVVSQTRLAIAEAVVLLLYAALMRPTAKLSARLGGGLLAASLIGGIWVGAQWSGQLEPLQARLEEGTSGDSLRSQKYALGMAAWASNLTTVLVGAKDSDLIVGVRPEDSFSDNSFITALVSVGLVGTAVVIFELFAFLRSMSKNRQFVTPLLILTTLFWNNAILWDVWIFLIFVAALLWTIRFGAPRERYALLRRRRPLSRMSTLEAGAGVLRMESSPPLAASSPG